LCGHQCIDNIGTPAMILINTAGLYPVDCGVECFTPLSDPTEEESAIFSFSIITFSVKQYSGIEEQNMIEFLDKWTYTLKDRYLPWDSFNKMNDGKHFFLV
jgi:hypothetical protein